MPAGQVNYPRGTWKRLRQVSTFRSQSTQSKHAVSFAKCISYAVQGRYFLQGKRVSHAKAMVIILKVSQTSGSFSSMWAGGVYFYNLMNINNRASTQIQYLQQSECKFGHIHVVYTKNTYIIHTEYRLVHKHDSSSTEFLLCLCTKG